MPKYIVDNGDDFSVDFLDRDFGGRAVNVFKIKGSASGAIEVKDLAVSGTFTAASLTLSGDISLDDLTVGDDLTVVGDATVGGTLGVTGLTTLASATLSGTVGVTGLATLATVARTGAETLSAGAHFVLATTGAGTQLGTGATQLLGFWGATAVVQHSSTAQTAGFVVVGSSAVVAPESTFTGGTGTKAYTIGDVVRALKLAGIMAAS